MATDSTASFQDAMRAKGLEPPASILWDDKLHRFPGPDKPKRNDDGWYRAFSDQRCALFGDHAIYTGERLKWKLNNGRRPDDFDPAAWKKMMAEQKKKMEERAKAADARHAEVAIECQERWKSASDAKPDHPYFVSKGITDAGGLRIDGDKLLIPMKACRDNSIVSIQAIGPDGEKRFAYEGEVVGTRTSLGVEGFNPKGGTLYICEGWATGWTINHVTQRTVVVAFNCGNLMSVAEHHREKFPEARIVIVADNDRWKKVRFKGKKDRPNPGVLFARDVAKATKSAIAIPDFKSLDGKPTDFNDLWVREGAEAVEKWLDPDMADKAAILPSKTDDAFTETPRADVPAAENEDSDPWYKKAPFRCLGYNGPNYYYLSDEKSQITILSPGAHDSRSLMQIAPLTWWEQLWPGRTHGCNWVAAANALMRASHRSGVFRQDRMRGRGCWPDEKGTIVHLGDRLLPPDSDTFIDPGHFICSDGLIYERLPKLTGPSKKRALDVDEGRELLGLFTDLWWQDESSGILLAGWTVLAPICGSLEWRPHVWLVGGAGVGKTQIMEKLIQPLLGGMEIRFEGGSTEAGMRQTVRVDAIPVIFDEAERTDQKSDSRLQGIIALLRSASSTTGPVVKGTQDGSGMSFEFRSMGCLASIGGSLRQEADRSRISILQLKPKGAVPAETRRAHWIGYKERLGEMATKAKGRELVARTIKWLRDGRLEKTVTTFRTAANIVLGDARAGDQYGTLFAGAWLLMSDEPPSVADAKEYLSSAGLDVYVTEQDPEGMSVLRAIMETRERIDSKKGPVTLTVGQMVLACCGVQETSCSEEDAKGFLRQVGLKVDMGTGDYKGEYVLLVANKSAWIDGVLEKANSPYVGNVRNALKTIVGSRPGGMVRFSAMQSRVTSIPLSTLKGTE